MKIKIIIPVFITVVLIALLIIFNIPYSLNNSLNFDKSEQIIISIITLENVSGQPMQKGENFTFEKGSAELTSINELFDGYSYYLTIARDINRTGNDIYTAVILISDGNSNLHLTNLPGSNVIINDKNYRMKQNKIEELISKILDICGI